MARIRTIKPEFFTSEDIVELCPYTRLLYIALWCEADREGRLNWKPKTFKMRYFPADDCDIDAMCDALVTRGLLVKYASEFAFIPSFSTHQHVNPREKSSIFPEPTAETIENRRDSDASRRDSDGECTLREERKGKERKGKEGNIFPDAVAPEVRPKVSDEIAQKRRSTWESYQTAYFNRYGTEPVRNAKTNSCIAKLVSDLGDDAPYVAQFYLQHNDAWYVKKMHPIDSLVKDAAGLRTQWATNRTVTGRDALQVEKMGSLSGDIRNALGDLSQEF